MTHRRALAPALVLLALAGVTLADVVVLTNGNEIVGEVTSQDGAEKVVVKTRDGTLTFPKRQVKEVRREAGDQGKGARGGTTPPPGTPPGTPPAAGGPAVTPATPAAGEDYATRRRGFRTKLGKRGPGPGTQGLPAMPAGVTAVKIPAPQGELQAWIVAPPEGERVPGVVVLHDGFALTAADLNETRPLFDAGFAVLYLTLRGEHGNPGAYELLMGEVDDAAAAVRWLARHERVDRNRVHAWGRGVGGALAAVLSLLDTPLRSSGSVNGLYVPDTFRSWRADATSGAEVIRFDPAVAEECAMRLLLGHVRDMRTRHVAFVGQTATEQHGAAAALDREAIGVGAGRKLVMVPVDGNGLQAEAAGLAVFVESIRRGE